MHLAGTVSNQKATTKDTATFSRDKTVLQMVTTVVEGDNLLPQNQDAKAKGAGDQLRYHRYQL